MAQPKDLPSFTHGHAVRDDGAVEFRCSDDAKQWPFLELPPWHPIAIQTLQFWSSVEASMALGAWDDSKWSALTWCKWTSGVDTGHAVRGLSEHQTVDGKVQQRLTFFDAGDALVYDISLAGVIFQNRDFEGWRSKAKQDAAPAEDLGAFEFAPRQLVGSETTGPAFLAPLGAEDPKTARGLISKENAMPPHHKYLGGSGDHVNAAHLAEAAHQFLYLTGDGTPLTITGGEMRFTSYVELGRPFGIELTGKNGNETSMQVTQGGKACTAITLSAISASAQ